MNLLTIPCTNAANGCVNNSRNYILFDFSSVGISSYYWIILDVNGNLLDTGYITHYPPDTEMINNNILLLKIKTGNAIFYKFYDLINSRWACREC